MVDNWLFFIQSMIFPSTCLVCGAAGDAGEDICFACRDDLPWLGHACRVCAIPLRPPATRCGHCILVPPAWCSAVAVCRYDFPADALVGELKFRHRMAAGRLMGGLLAQAVETQRADHRPPDRIVSLPLHRRRLAERGFNQASEITRELSRRSGIPSDGSCLTRIRATEAQHLLPAKERRRNVHGAFRSHSVDGLEILLVDDVMTTGATLEAATAALLAAGAAQVDVAVFARAPRLAHPK